MQLHEIKAPKGAKTRRIIVGRGTGSGHGKTCGRGHKGQKSRAGRGIINSLEGGQVPLIRRIPKLGFRSKRPILYQIVTVGHLDQFSAGTVITRDFLKSKGLIKSLNRPFKILGDGELKKSLILKVENVSQSAQEKIVKAGGKIEAPAKDAAKT